MARVTRSHSRGAASSGDRAKRPPKQKLEKSTQKKIPAKTSRKRIPKSHKWVGFSIPYRLADGTYGVFSSVPPVEIYPEVKDITSLQELQEHLPTISRMFHSPTSCYFEIDSEEKTFFHDQQDCVVWRLRDDGKVDTTSGLVVADSLPEFLSRVIIESRIWMITKPIGGPLLTFLGAPMPVDLSELRPEERAYVENYSAS
eukprot:GFYU01003321.1.p1 GENE.GFYU01003321.1~~GFYU01003321.1.p1  ORF type:complete len:200 (-),score=32.08 GFYU01003321.1:164-763(-)